MTIERKKLHPQQNTVAIRGRDNNLKIKTTERTKKKQPQKPK